MKKNNPFLFLITIAIFLAGVLFFFTFVLNPTKGLFENKNSDIDTKTLQQNYGNLNQLSPGSSTQEDVIKTNGNPSRTEIKDQFTYMYYETPFEKDGNVVVLHKDIVEYVFEYVFGDYRGSYEKIY